MTRCAVRGIETAGGRGLGGGHRKGPHRLRQGRARRRRLVAAVLRQSRRRAAAAQSAGLGHAHRSRSKAARRSRPREAAFGFRKRMDGGYTVATLGVRRSTSCPTAFGCSSITCPPSRLHWKKLRFRVGRRWVEEWRTPRRWALDAAIAVRGGARARSGARPRRRSGARRHLARSFPVFRNAWSPKAGAA